MYLAFIDRHLTPRVHCTIRNKSYTCPFQFDASVLGLPAREGNTGTLSRGLERRGGDFVVWYADGQDLR